MIKFLERLLCEHEFIHIACLKRIWSHEGLYTINLQRCGKERTHHDTPFEDTYFNQRRKHSHKVK